MKRNLVLLQFPIGDLDRVQVRVGARTIEDATNLKPDQIAALFHDDRLAIERAMAR